MLRTVIEQCINPNRLGVGANLLTALRGYFFWT